MTHIVDDFLDKDTYDAVYNRLLTHQFMEIELGDKLFWVQPSDDDFNNLVLDKISKIDGKERKCLLGFFRVATEEFDTDWRIHADSKVGDIRPEKALVIYISPSTKEGVHGTAFWKHKDLGYSIPEDISDEEFNRLLMEEANVLENWELSSVIGYRPNRMVTYPSTVFHSKYPNTGWKEGRMIYVMFYI